MTHDRAKIWFFTDIHGSNACFRKFLRSVENSNQPNVLIIGGDITGKQVIPIVAQGDRTSVTVIEGKQQRYYESDLKEVQTAFSDNGHYPFLCDQKEYQQFVLDDNYQQSIRRKLIRERLEEWIKLADDRLPDPDICQAIVNLGNDDSLDLDTLLDRSKKLVRPEGKVLDLPCNLKLLSTGYSNITPWSCPRDVEELELQARIARMTQMLETRDLRRLVFNFHCPPKDTALDRAIKIDRKTLQPEASFKGAKTEHVGSTAIRAAIETWQPVVALHGHIHESAGQDRIGNTPCFNPGTDYQRGGMPGVFLQINSAAEIEIQVMTPDAVPGGKGSHPVEDAAFAAIPVFGSAVRDAMAPKNPATTRSPNGHK